MRRWLKLLGGLVDVTKKLYYSDPTCKEWETTITKVEKVDDSYLVTLKETAFYPEGGGQPYDTGTIGSLDVVDVFERDGEVFHKVTSEPATDTVVHCKIDWNRRFDHTQQHTGQHLLSAVLIELFDYQTVSFHLGTDSTTIDVTAQELTEQEIIQVEEMVNQYIYDNKQINTYFVTKEEMEALRLRKTPDVTEPIRIVEIEGIDLSACCGTHINQTGELGIIKIIKTEKQKGNVRIHFKCGKRALVDYQQSSKLIGELAYYISGTRENVMNHLVKIESENKQLQKQMELLKEENHHYQALQLVQEHTSPIMFIHFDDISFKEIQGLARAVLKDADKLVIFTTANENKLFVAHNGSINLHCGKFFKQELAAFQGKGGGNANSAQAGFSNANDMKKFATYLREKVGL